MRVKIEFADRQQLDDDERTGIYDTIGYNVTIETVAQALNAEGPFITLMYRRWTGPNTYSLEPVIIAKSLIGVVTEATPEDLEGKL